MSRKQIDPELLARRELAVTNWERKSALPLAILAIAFLALWAVQVLAPVTDAEWDVLEGTILFIWVAFIGDFLVRLSTTPTASPSCATTLWRSSPWWFRHSDSFACYES